MTTRTSSSAMSTKTPCNRRYNAWVNLYISHPQKSGSITDVDGRFVLSASKGDKLVVSYIGMKTAKVKAEPKVTVTLKDE